MHKHRNWRKTLSIPAVIIVLACLLITSSPLKINSQTASAADSVFYDFITQASGASWSSGTGSLSFPGSDDDSRGFALYRDNWQLEDNSTWARALETHPQWVSNGWIQGKYPQMTIPSNAELKATVGFFKGATGSDGVTFKVQFEEFLGLQVAPKIYSILSHVATYDGKLDSIAKELSSLEGKKGNFILYVNAGQSSGQDWAAWAEAQIKTAPSELPDLIVSKIECGPGNKLSVTIENIGSGALPAGWAAVAETYFDDEKKGFFDLTSPTSTSGGGIEEPGGSSTYLLAWGITAPVTVRVMADSTNDVTESNEQNNSKEEEIEPLVVTELPDLIIEEIVCDQENSRIGYVIKNSGEAVAPAVHATILFVDGEAVGKDIVDQKLEPGESYQSWFDDYTWLDCQTIKVTVCADNPAEVEESNEQNNCLSQECECVADTIPPQIISGPVVSQVTQTSAVICWATDEASDSLVRYDNYAGQYANVVEDLNLVKEHCLNLTNLEAGVIYHFIVEPKDSSGNEVRSQDLNFETLPYPDEEKPSLSLLIPDTLSGKPTIHATAQDNVGVDRVMFFLDGKLVFTDFSTPFEWECNTSALDEGSHSFGAQAFDVAGNVDEHRFDSIVRNRFPVDLSPVRVRIITPANRSDVYSEVGILAEISHDNDLRISRIEFIVDEDIIRGDDFDPPISLIPILTPTFTVSCPWDTSGVELGAHNIRVRARDEVGNWGDAGIVVEVVEPSTPSISVTREVHRIDPEADTYFEDFEVILTLQNNSDVDVTNLTISMTNTGFQCIGNALLRSVDWGDFGAIRCTVVNDRDYYWRSTLQASLGTLQRGRTKVLKYYVVPILVNDPAGSLTPTIGSESTISFQAWGREYSQHPSLRWSNSLDRSSALGLADYLIVTSPQALFDHYPEADVNELLSTMAELAKEKLGVLGYISSGTTAEELKHLIERDGAWSVQLCPGWAEGNGYLLIVGERDIVPMYNYDIDMTTLGDEPTDYVYTDTFGADELPELRIGRIIGNSAANLAIPIRNSILVHQAAPGHHYNATEVLLVSGVDGNSTIQAHFNQLIEDIQTDYVPDAYIIHWSDYTGGNALSDRAQAFKEQAQLGKDLIFYAGHGGEDGFSSGLDAWAGSSCPAEPLDLGENHPVVFATACSTGRYWTVRAGHDSIARVFLENGAAVFIGIVWGLGIFDHFSVGVKFVELYSSPPSSCIGDVFKRLQADRMSLIGSDAAWRSVVYRYHLYGDPKFGVR